MLFHPIIRKCVRKLGLLKELWGLSSYCRNKRSNSGPDHFGLINRGLNKAPNTGIREAPNTGVLRTYTGVLRPIF